jgi:coenzyme F420 hydrogenase subunit beta
LLGNYLTCYIGHATDHEVRYNSASGGLVTALLIFALEEGLIDGALVTKMNRDSPLEAQPFIARTKEEIMSASKSKYCPVPVNVAIKEILDTEKEQFAVVGLPCHIWGFRKAELISKELRDKISLHFGLFCTHVPSFLATEYILKRMKVEKEDVSRLNYRGEGWPGKMSIVTKQTSIRLKVEDYYGSGFGSFLFCPVRCTLCPDALAELADISFGDAWLSELRTDKIGKSMVISRSVTSGCLLDSAQKKGKIKLNAVNEEQVVQAQQGPLSFKKRLLPARVRLCKSTGKKVPNYNMKLSKTSLATYLSAMRCYAILYLGLQKHLRDSLIYRMLVGLFPLTQSSNGQIPKSCRPY